MRVECEACHEVVAASLAVRGDAVRATCAACGHVMVAPVAPAGAPQGEGAAGGGGSSAGEGPRAIDDDRRRGCPKCGAPRRPDTAACATCGLAVARMAGYTDPRGAGIPEPVRDAWARATAAWDDPARHDDVLRLVAAHGCYAWAAGRYRGRGRDAVAARQLDRLRRAAEATLLASATVRPDRAARPYQATLGVLAILIAAIAVGLIYARVARAPSGVPVAPAVPARPLTPLTPLTPGHPVSPPATQPDRQVR